jgi:hypothetical protein
VHLESQAPALSKLFTVSFETSRSSCNKRLATEIGTFGKSRIPLKRPQLFLGVTLSARLWLLDGENVLLTNLVSPKSWGSLVAGPPVACGLITITILVDIAMSLSIPPSDHISHCSAIYCPCGQLVFHCVRTELWRLPFLHQCLGFGPSRRPVSTSDRPITQRARPNEPGPLKLHLSIMRRARVLLKGSSRYAACAQPAFSGPRRYWMRSSRPRFDARCPGERAE